jgi:hypothetical protein
MITLTSSSMKIEVQAGNLLCLCPGIILTGPKDVSMKSVEDGPHGDVSRII